MEHISAQNRNFNVLELIQEMIVDLIRIQMKIKLTAIQTILSFLFFVRILLEKLRERSPIF